VAVVLLASFYLGIDPILEKYSLLSGDISGRTEAWKMTYDIAQDYPVFGTGLGTFVHISPKYQTISITGGHWAQSHNDYLNLMSDTGTAGFAIGVIFLLAWFVYVLRCFYRKNLRTYQKSIAAGCIAGVTAILIHSIADFNLQIPANAFYFATLLGLAVAVLRPKDSQYVNRRAGESRDSLEKAGGSEKTGPWVLTQKLTVCGIVVLLGVTIVPSVVGTMRAEYLLAKGKKASNPEKAVQAFKESISLDECNPESHYQLGMVEYWDRKDYVNSRESFRRAVQLAPSVERYHFRLGMSHARLGEHTLAEGEFSLAKSFAPVRPDIHYEIAFYHFFAWRRSGEIDLLDKAFVEFKRAAEIRPEYLAKSLKLVAGYLPQYENLARLVPDTHRHHWSFAAYLEKTGRWQEALNEYRTVWRLKLEEDRSYRGDVQLCLASARAHLMTGDVEDAKRGYLKAIHLGADSDRAIVSIRRDFAKAGKIRECLPFLRELADGIGDSEILKLEIASCHAALGDYDIAEELLLGLIERRPTGRAYRQLFSIAMQRKEYGLAEIYAEKAILLDPSDASWFALLARAREDSGDYSGALQAIQRALSIEPGNNSYRKQLDRLNARIPADKRP
jgi:tetratricopeptide (TPR) repeat protein